MIQENHIITNIGKKDILADVSFLPQTDPQPLVIFCHGYKGFKDWGAWNLVAEAFAKAGFCFLKFNFSHNGGTVDNPIDFPDLESFAKNTYSLELEDVKRVIDYVYENKALNIGQSISLIGHSRGGGIATLAAAQDHRINKLITWAGVADFKSRFPVGKDLEEWKQKGVNYVTNARTQQQMPHNYFFYEDFIQNETSLDILYHASKLRIPHLIIHGTVDKAVSINEAYLLQQSHPKAQIFELQTNHVFGTKHPFLGTSLPSEMQEIYHRCISFLRK